MRDDERGLFTRGARLVASYVRAHPKPFVLAVIGAFTFACASVAVSAALGRVTDQVLRPAFEEGVRSRTVWLGVLAIMGLASLRAVSIMVRRYQSGAAGAAVAATLRRQVSDRYRDLSLAFHRATPTGELLAHMEADVEASVDVYYPVPFAVGALLLAVFALGSLVLADPFLAAIGLIVIPALVLMNRTFARRMQPPAEHALQSIADVSAVAHESIDGALVVKTLGREPAEIERPRAVTGHRRIEQVLAQPVRVPPPAHSRPIPDGPLGVTAERVSYAFAGSRVLEAVPLEIRPDESVALVGPADSILMFEGGRIVERGTYAELVAAGGVYARLHRSWLGNVRT